MYKHLLILFFSITISCQLEAQVDTTHGFTAPSSVSKDHIKLTKYLCEGIENEQLKANLIFNWVTHNLTINIKDGKNPEKQNPSIKEVLNNSNTVVGGYLTLFTNMCREAGLRAIQISGYRKKFYHNLGADFYIARASLCAVFINGTWQFVDPVSGSGRISHEPKWFRKQLNKVSKKDILYEREGVFEVFYNPKYFMIAPEEVRRDFLIADPIWQLLTPPMPLNIFSGSENSIAAFSENSNRINNTTTHTKIGNLSEDEQILERVQRTHKFNPKFWIDMALSEQIKSYKLLQTYINAPLDGDAKKAIIEAINLRKQAGVYIDTQKKYIPAYYTSIKKANMTKHMAASGRVRTVRRNIKTETSALNRQLLKSDSKRKALLTTKAENLEQNKSIDPDKIKKIRTGKEQKDAKSTTLVAKVVSINAKSKEIQEQNEFIKIELSNLEKHFAKIDPNFDAYTIKSAIVDSLLELEAYSMIGLNLDDDELTQEYISQSDALWEEIVTLRETLLQAYDSTLSSFNNIDKAIEKQHKLYGDILKKMEEYKVLNSEWTELESIYAETVNNYESSINSRNQNINLILELHNLLINKFQQINKNRENSNETTEWMEKIETQRKDITDFLVADDKEYDEGQLKKMTTDNKKAIKELKELLTKQ